MRRRWPWIAVAAAALVVLGLLVRRGEPAGPTVKVLGATNVSSEFQMDGYAYRSILFSNGTDRVYYFQAQSQYQGSNVWIGINASPLSTYEPGVLKPTESRMAPLPIPTNNKARVHIQ